MPYLLFFVTEDDLPILIDRFNQDEEIAFLIPQEASTPRTYRSRAVRTVQTLADGKHGLWFVPGGLEQQSAGPPEVPFSGANPHEHMRLTLWTRHLPYTLAERFTRRPLISFWDGKELLAVSDLQFGARGQYAMPASQKRWFARMKTWIARAAVKLEAQGSGEKFYAFPSALALLKRGVPYYANGFPLDREIAEAAMPVRPLTPAKPRNQR
jgi:hypothetical protein